MAFGVVALGVVVAAIVVLGTGVVVCVVTFAVVTTGVGTGTMTGAQGFGASVVGDLALALTANTNMAKTLKGDMASE